MTQQLLNQAFLAKITIIKVFPCRGEHVRTYISESRYAWWQKITNRHTHTHRHTHTRDNYSNPRCAHARRGLITGTGLVAHGVLVILRAYILVNTLCMVN